MIRLPLPNVIITEENSIHYALRFLPVNRLIVYQKKSRTRAASC